MPLTIATLITQDNFIAFIRTVLFTLDTNYISGRLINCNTMYTTTMTSDDITSWSILSS